MTPSGPNFSINSSGGVYVPGGRPGLFQGKEGGSVEENGGTYQLKLWNRMAKTYRRDLNEITDGALEIPLDVEIDRATRFMDLDSSEMDFLVAEGMIVLSEGATGSRVRTASIRTIMRRHATVLEDGLSYGIDFPEETPYCTAQEATAITHTDEMFLVNARNRGDVKWKKEGGRIMYHVGDVRRLATKKIHRRQPIKGYMTRPQVQARTGLSYWQVKTRQKAGVFESELIKGQWRIKTESVEAHMINGEFRDPLTSKQ